MAIEYKLINTTFSSLSGLQGRVNQEAGDGWVVQASGPFYMFLGREAGLTREHQVARVLFSDTDWVIRFANEHAKEGWSLSALGPSYAFFTRPRGAVEPVEMRWRARGIGLLTPGGIRELLRKEGRDGWKVRGMTAGSAVFEKPTSGANPVEHLLEGTLLKTAGMVERLCAERGAEGWRLACASRLFLAFAREIAD